MNDQTDANTAENVLNEINGKTRQAVAVHDHHLLHTPSESAVQDGLQAAPVEVDARSHVTHKGVLRVACAQLVDLPLEIRTRLW